MTRSDPHRIIGRDVAAYLAAFEEDAARRTAERAFSHSGVTVTLRGRVFPSDSHLTLTTQSTIGSLMRSISERWLSVDAPYRVLDIGTASGIVAVSVASALPNARVIAADIDDDAVLLARENAARAGRANIEVRRSDLFSSISEVFDVVVCSLPIAEAWHEAHGTSPAPRRTLERFWEQAPAHLATNGLIYFNWANWADLGAVEALASAAGFVPEDVDDYSLTGTPFFWRTYRFVHRRG